ncbi:MAG: multidrug ABC transporter ATP-binding protein [Alcaligenaceae bacterium]|jgi:ABC-2 type transport system ATP-binding protein|nr:multidrug ABC transporter ATP-binding protein [Alcaligenaceae bacterium]
MSSVISIRNVSKTYASGHRALNNINLDIQRGEIFALLGPNGAGKTTLISMICGLVNLDEGEIVVGGHDIKKEFRAARSQIGLVPQELTAEAFEKVWNTVSYSRGLFGKRANPAHIEKILKDLSLWERRDSRLLTLSGGMKRRVLIAKALSHEPPILFLDEPTAGVDVTLRKGMWDIVRKLRDTGVTIILTTHYIEEAEEMADRIGVIRQGELILVEEKARLMRSLGKKELTLQLSQPLPELPATLANTGLKLSADGQRLMYAYRTQESDQHIADLLHQVHQANVVYTDLHTRQSSLEDIFVDLVQEPQ